MTTFVYSKERGFFASIMLFISAFIIIIGTATPWFEVNILGIFDLGEFNLHDYDDINESGFGGALVLFSIFLIIIALISLARYHIILKISGVILSVIAFFVTIAAIANIAENFEGFEDFYSWRAGPIVTIFGCLLAIISSALLKDSQKLPTESEKPVEKPITPSTTTPPSPPQKTQEPSLPKEALKEQIICKNCGKAVSKTSTFCPYCGTYVRENTSQ